MRLTIAAAAAVALAQPAAAQRIDMRVIDVVESPDGFTCRSHALPELRIAHDWRGTGRSAGWTFRARESRPGDQLHMSVAFAPAEERAFGVGVRVSGFALRVAGLPRPVASARLRVDGTDNPTPVRVDSDPADPAAVSLALVDRHREAFADRLMSASDVEIELVDAAGESLRRYSWEVRRLRQAPELLQLINWSCQ